MTDPDDKSALQVLLDWDRQIFNTAIEYTAAAEGINAQWRPTGLANRDRDRSPVKTKRDAAIDAVMAMKPISLDMSDPVTIERIVDEVLSATGNTSLYGNLKKSLTRK